jgi:hypothetical protein
LLQKTKIIYQTIDKPQKTALTSDLSWDGKNVNDGTYYYVIKAESSARKLFDEKGYLLRMGK